MKNFKLFSKVLILTTMIGIVACGGDDNETSNTTMMGQASIKATDATVDAENVNAVYLSVSEIQATANGQSKTVVAFDTPNQFNIMAYQNGQTYFMGNGDLEAGSYTDLRFITSAEADSYIEFNDNSTKTLDVENGNSTGYQIQGAFEIAASSTTELVADIDLRKALVVTNNGSFKLRSTARLVVENETGKIEGTVSGSTNSSDRIVVYAYEKGTFNDSEENAPSDGRTRYEGSTNSSTVAENGSYTLAFMENGEYDIVVASYDNQDEDEDLEFKGRLETTLTINGQVLDAVDVSSNTTITADIIVL